MVRRLRAELWVRASAEVGEGPVWHSRSSTLSWVDITRGRWLRTDTVTGVTSSVDTGTLLGAVLPAQGDTFVAAVAEGFAHVDSTGKLRLASPGLLGARERMNDARCDPFGRVVAGSTARDLRAGQGRLHCWDVDGTVRQMWAGLTLPNGLDWSTDASTFALADSLTRTVWRAPYSRETGTVGQPEAWLQLPAGDGLPDGLCVDADDGLWLAVWGAGQVRRYTPDARLDTVIDVPVSLSSSCAIDACGRMAITTARSDLDETQRAQQPLAGSLFVVDVGVPGQPAVPYAGS